MENVNDSYFNGHYKDIWRSVIPAELTVREADFILQYFNLQPGNKVLDLMCGYGRHSLALARKGMQVTAVDNLTEYIQEIEAIAEKENLPIVASKTNVLDYGSNELFSLVLCMGNSLNFFDEEDTCRLLSSINGQLQKEGRLLIHTWSLAEIAIKQFVEKTWKEIDGLKFLVDSRYLFHPTRIESETTIISSNGDMEIKRAIDHIFSVAEMEKMLNRSGFILKEIYSIPGRKKFTLGDPRAYIVASKE
jgi:SAM-dependent methyltransferase